MTGFDGELYLRTRGEEMLLGLGPARHGPWDSPLLEPAEALVAIGAIRPSRATAVIDDYGLAEAMRSDDGHHPHYRTMGGGSRSRRSGGVALKPRRVVPCNRTIEDSNGELLVRHVALSEDATSLAITWRPKTSGQRRLRRRGRMMARLGHGSFGPHEPQLTDDRGKTVATGFGGGGSDEEWEGHLTADQPLAPDTAWIEIDGTRLELTGEAVACDVKIEPLAEEATAHRYLWRRLAIPDFHGLPEIEGSIDALIAAGALQPDDPVLDEIRAVREAMPHHPGMFSGGPGGRRSLPEPWRSVFRRQGKQDGPNGTIALSAVTPEFDGFSVAISCLESGPDGFRIEVDVAPGLEGHGHLRALGSRRLAWWAADDRGNHHLGMIGSWGGGESYSSGEINFGPALRPKARRLSIMPTGDTSRAVISVPLTWDRTEASGQAEPA